MTLHEGEPSTGLPESCYRSERYHQMASFSSVHRQLTVMMFRLPFRECRWEGLFIARQTSVMITSPRLRPVGSCGGDGVAEQPVINT